MQARGKNRNRTRGVRKAVSDRGRALGKAEAGAEKAFCGGRGAKRRQSQQRRRAFAGHDKKSQAM
jgi:hypothetical protein